MLHIVNGDAFARKLAASGVAGNILAWREALYEGPIGEDLSANPLLEKRAAYMERRHGVPAETFVASTQRQEQELAALAETADSVVLWFEHDLYDQLMLAYLLSRLVQAGVQRERLYMVCMGSFPGVEPFFGLGQLTPEQAASLHGTWEAVREEQLRLGVRIWEAYTDSAPVSLANLLAEDLSALPFVQTAIRTHMERYPSVSNGLNGLQQLVLQQLKKHEGRMGLLPLFHSISEQASDYGLGDLQFWALIDELRTSRVPLVGLRGGDQLPRFGQQLPEDFDSWRLELLEAGIQVLHGQADHVQLNGVDEHIGGVHLCGSEGIWRWDPAAMRVLRK